MSNEPTRDQLKIGMEVEINPRQDRTRKELVTGKVEELLTRASEHPHGILVRLIGGQIGRVKKMLSLSSDDPGLSGSTTQVDPFSTEVPNLGLLISDGENHFVEFKSSMLWSLKLSSEEINKSTAPILKDYGATGSKVIIGKTLAALLNSDGGHLIVGIKENKDDKSDEIIGIESEFNKLTDPCEDGYRRMIIDRIIKPYFPSYVLNHFNDYLKISFEEIEGKTLCWIRVKKSDDKVFLKTRKGELFFIRVDSTTRQIYGEEIVDFCKKRFS